MSFPESRVAATFYSSWSHRTARDGPFLPLTLGPALKAPMDILQMGKALAWVTWPLAAGHAVVKVKRTRWAAAVLHHSSFLRVNTHWILGRERWRVQAVNSLRPLDVSTDLCLIIEPLPQPGRVISTKIYSGAGEAPRSKAACAVTTQLNSRVSAATILSAQMCQPEALLSSRHS